jgi:carbonic anhydrase
MLPASIMNSLINLIGLVSVEKTLIITGGKYADSKYLGFLDEVSIFTLPDNLLHRYDPKQKARLQKAIEETKCTQIIFLGMLDLEMEHFLASSLSLHSVRAGLRFKTPLLPTNENGIEYHQRSFALLEQHVMTQCNHLMEFYFVKEKIKNGQLSVRGIVGTSNTDTFKTVFTNGIRFNDLPSMN